MPHKLYDISPSKAFSRIIKTFEHLVSVYNNQIEVEILIKAEYWNGKFWR